MLFDIVLGFMYGSLVEYFLHRYYLHTSFNTHIVWHHKAFGVGYFSRIGVKFSDVGSSYRYFLANLVLYLLFFLLVFSSYAFLVTCVLYYIWTEMVHYMYHSHKRRTIERFKFFARLKLNHKLHHTFYTVNYGIGSPIWDFILGTYRR